MSMRSVGLCFLNLTLICMAGRVSSAQTAPAVHIGGGITRIDDIGFYEVGWVYRNGQGGSMPVGWTGHFDEATGISCTPFGSQAGKSAFLIHPPWRGGTGVTNQTFHLALPTASEIRLNFAVAMKEGEVGPGKSDGATFRVFVNGVSLYDFNQTTAVWAPSFLNLTKYAGQTITLRFQGDPGPRDNPSFDYALWGDRQLEVTGAARAIAAVSFPQPLRALDRDYRNSGDGSVSPLRLREPTAQLILTSGTSQTGLTGGAVVQVHSSARSLYASPAYGVASGAYLVFDAKNGALVRSDLGHVSSIITADRIPGGEARSIQYRFGERSVRIEEELTTTDGDFVKLHVHSSDPYIASINFGSIGPVAFRRQITVPYYGVIQYFPDNGLFANVMVDHKVSQASRIDGVSAFYDPLTNGARNKLDETVYFAISPDPLCVLPKPGNPASPFRQVLANKVVLDTWGGEYTDNATFLKELAGYRITNLLTIAHVWQNGGYDNKLPDVLPAYAPLGGDAGMLEWTRTAEGLGEMIALHENYVDFYPNAPSWNQADVACDGNGQREKAWFNEGTGIQSFAVAPDAILKYARQITPQVQAQLSPNASYLDVHSSVPPWFHVDFRADQAGAGKFQTVWNAHRDLWQYFREVHKGPVLGEGANHWFWSGLLDGVEAQFGVGVPGNSGQTAPLFVDFDLAAIHPLQFNHGMGYLERWLPSDFDAVWHTRIPSMKTLDQYRMQEVAYGHAGFIASPFQNSLPFIWQEHHLISPLAGRYATAKVRRIEYEVGGRLLPSAGAIAAGCAFDRVKVTYENGLTIWANSRSAEWGPEGAGAVLPQYGWCASAPGFRAGTTLGKAESGASIVTDMADSNRTLFVNARSTYAGPEQPRNIRPEAGDFKQTGPRSFTIRYTWHVGEPVPAGYVVFVHFTGASGAGSEKIAFQSGSGIDAAAEKWPVGNIQGRPVAVTLPGNLPDGAYEVRTGLYSPSNGERLRIKGVSDGTDRILTGQLTIKDNSEHISFAQAPSASAPNALDREREEHINLRKEVVDFGKAATNGSFLFEQEKPGLWILTPYPRDTPITVILRSTQIDPLLKKITVQALNNAGKPLGVVPVTESGHGELRFTLGKIPATVHYRVTSAK
jgi:hypothetical protein